MELQEVKVLVPADRMSEFYRWFADWTESLSPDPAPNSGAKANKETADLLEAATAWWKSLKVSERSLWSLWIEASPRLLTAQEIVDALSLKGPRDIPGILSWSGRKGDKVGFKVGWSYQEDASGQALYGLRRVGSLSAEDYADLLRRAKSAAEA